MIMLRLAIAARDAHKGIPGRDNEWIAASPDEGQLG